MEFEYDNGNRPLKDLIQGLYFGYNKCCVMNYWRLVHAGKAPAAHMEAMNGNPHSHEYVLCHDCAASGKAPERPKRRKEWEKLANKVWHLESPISEEPPPSGPFVRALRKVLGIKEAPLWRISYEMLDEIGKPCSVCWHIAWVPTEQGIRCDYCFENRLRRRLQVENRMLLVVSIALILTIMRLD